MGLCKSNLYASIEPIEPNLILASALFSSQTSQKECEQVDKDLYFKFQNYYSTLLTLITLKIKIKSLFKPENIISKIKY